MRRYDDCQFEEDGDCAACSLSSYGKDCRNNPANSLAFYRTAKHLTQKELEEASGVSLSKIRKIEYGEIRTENLTLRVAVSLAKALDINAEALL